MMQTTDRCDLIQSSLRCPKRVMTEIFSLISQDYELTVHKSSHNSDLPQCFICITTWIRGFKVNLHLPPDYPFNIPTVLVNSKNYTNLFTVHSKRELIDILKEKKNMDIFQNDGNSSYPLCRLSIVCTNNWRPCHQLKDIYKEIEFILDTKQRLIEKLLTKIIFSSYYKHHTNIDMAMAIATFL